MRQAHSFRFHWALGSTLMGKGEEEQGMKSRFSSKEPVISDTVLERKRTETIHDQKELKSARLRGAHFPWLGSLGCAIGVVNDICDGGLWTPFLPQYLQTLLQGSHHGEVDIWLTQAPLPTTKFLLSY